jgi:thymidylate synthase
MIVKEIVFDAWKEALNLVLMEGKEFRDENSRICREVFNLIIRVERPDLNIDQPIRTLNRFREWTYPSLEEIASVMLSTKLALDYSYSYGPRMFNFQSKINQINDFIIPLLKQNPTSRRAIITLFDPVEDSNIMKRDIPSLISIDFKLRDNKLNMTSVIRSNDMFFGWPANVYQMYVLQDYVRKKLGCNVGFIDTFSTSAHIFRDQFEYIKQILEQQ